MKCPYPRQPENRRLSLFVTIESIEQIETRNAVFGYFVHSRFYLLTDVCYHYNTGRTGQRSLTLLEKYMTMTLKKLVRFQKVRNKSGYASNLQFSIDARECGFDLKELGDAKPFTIDGFKGYLWNVPVPGVGLTRMVEFGSIHIEGQPFPHGNDWIPGQDTADMFKLLDEKAAYLQPAD